MNENTCGCIYILLSYNMKSFINKAAAKHISVKIVNLLCDCIMTLRAIHAIIYIYGGGIFLLIINCLLFSINKRQIP